MDLIVTDATGKPVASHASYTLDLAFGSGENDFDLQVEDAALKAGSRIMIDGTEYGGIIDDTDVDVDGGLSTVTWHGRDWHGVLASKIIEPDRNNDYLTLSGTIPVIMRTLVSRAGLQGLFTVTDESADHKTTCQFDRYVDLYSGLVKMLRASGLKLRLRNDGDKVSMSAMPVRTIGDSIDSDLIDFTAKQAAHPINHLICLGKGELKDRTVIHWYADANGTFSHTQTLKGLDERTATYELSNAEADELEDKGRQKFQELRNTSTIDVDIPDGIDADVGDLVTGRDNNTGLVVTAEISKKIVKVSGGVLTVTYESGGASAGGNSGESSIGGHARPRCTGKRVAYGRRQRQNLEFGASERRPGSARGEGRQGRRRTTGGHRSDRTHRSSGRERSDRGARAARRRRSRRPAGTAGDTRRERR